MTPARGAVIDPFRRRAVLSAAMASTVLDSERFGIVRPVGAGGMGIVYEARDRRTGERVAIKTLHELDGHALYRLKNEFRQLRGIVHDNLVRLRELVAENGAWFLVMDFIDGLDVVAHVRGNDREAIASTIDGKAAATMRWQALASPRPAADNIELDYRAVRRLAGEIGAGLHALHEAGCVHGTSSRRTSSSRATDARRSSISASSRSRSASTPTRERSWGRCRTWLPSRRWASARPPRSTATHSVSCCSRCSPVAGRTTATWRR
jgi:serine/threonine protein kinase